MSISKKFSASIISLLLMAALCSVYFFYKIEYKEEKKKMELVGRMAGQVIEESLTNFMLSRDSAALNEKISALKHSTESIRRIWLINSEGIVKGGTDSSLIEKKLTYAHFECRGCHDRRRNGAFLESEKTFRWVQPVRNKPACHRCHNPGAVYNGIILLDFSLIEAEKHVRKEIVNGSIVISLTIGMIGLCVLLLSHVIVNKRLNAVMYKVNRFKEGNYGVRIPVEGDDEISRLVEGFNEMADAISARDNERKRAEEEREKLIQELKITFGQVSRSQKIWQETFDSMGDLISIHDTDFNMIKVNWAFARYFGLHPREVINRKCYELFHIGGSPSVNCPQVATMREGRTVTAEISDPKTNRIFLISTFPYRFPDAEFSGVIHVAKDITEEREKEMRLIMSERLASLGQMASGIAHELNNPLAAILGCAEGLHSRVKRGQFDPQLFAKYLEIIEEEISRCKNITFSMLSFVRKTTYEKREMNINDTVDKTLEIIGYQGRLKEVEIIKKYGDLPVVQGNEGELRQVFMAIISNALDAIEDRGALSLETGFAEREVYVMIGDTGPGIPPEQVGRIFDPFFTTKTERGGTGLGLSIANRIVANHDGRIDVTTEKGKGTVFRITLPV